MNALDHSPIPVGKVLPPHARTFIPVLEPARAQPCYVGADDAGEWAVRNPSIVRVGSHRAMKAEPVDAPVARANVNLIDAFTALSVDRLIDETRDLQARMLGADFSVRDFALVAAIIQRLQASPRLVGALWIPELTA